jgi:glutamine amidotransferase
MITVVDYGMGNLGSILNMLKKIGAGARVAPDPEGVMAASKLILPGVGAFDNAMARLESLGLVDALNQRVLQDHVPVLGLCLGVQLLTRRSDEGVRPGLGWIAGETVRFKLPAGSGLAVPHMGWNYVKPARAHCLLEAEAEPPRFYFVHGFHLSCDDPADVIGTTEYGYEFPTVIGRGNIAGVQFHPEKSHSFGMRLLRNFAESFPC